jgi:hypothetical protein
MANPQSYLITRSNNVTEKEALSYLLAQDSDFILLDAAGRKMLLEMFNIGHNFSRAFDLVYLKNSGSNNAITSDDKDNIVFIELKTTKKYLPHNPQGFFFGATKNEFDLAEKLGEQYKFCFISLHKDSLSYSLLTTTELTSIIKTKRIQYQINL